MNPYKNIFGLAKELGLTKEALSDGAKQWTGQASLRSLSRHHLAEYEAKLRKMRAAMRNEKHHAVLASFERNATLSNLQISFLVDLIADVFDGDLNKFRVWLGEFFKLSSERFIDTGRIRKVIKALTAMREKGFKAWK